VPEAVLIHLVNRLAKRRGRLMFVFRDVLMASAWGLNMAFAEWVIRSRLPSN
jgi:hypothetical protein